MLASELFQTVNLANSIVVSPHLDEEKVEETEMGNTVDLEHGDYAYPPIERKDINRKERLEKANCYLDGNLQSKIVMHLRILILSLRILLVFLNGAGHAFTDLNTNGRT